MKANFFWNPQGPESMVGIWFPWTLSDPTLDSIKALCEANGYRKMCFGDWALKDT